MVARARGAIPCEAEGLGEGLAEGLGDGEAVRDGEGVALGLGDGDAVGEALGLVDGEPGAGLRGMGAVHRRCPILIGKVIWLEIGFGRPYPERGAHASLSSPELLLLHMHIYICMCVCVCMYVQIHLQSTATPFEEPA